MHEHSIAHMDISSRNFVIASNVKHPELRLLLMDMEFAVRFPEGIEPTTDIWNEAFKPPEGKYGVNALAYDVYCTGKNIKAILNGYNIEVMCEGAPWPVMFLKLIERMIDPSPKRRPTAAEADAVMQSIDENQPLPHSGISTQTVIDFGCSIQHYPALACGTPLPIFSASSTNEPQW
ncbi:hypothetical protein M407DRAFT_22631 [Tulasnella calospora MUT 4182]|uniref:Protein kinase domain-containing protein n=1 Tax=Tulasnella calospora MUT 4182 TaxID=1051891 RepID=A0A0C3QMN4_9AGAM|nr:hypothetical protein M407DRAFT_22631 [Tulasnella calospora MUT 4182]